MESKVAVFMITHNKLPVMQEVVELLHKYPGMDFDFHVIDNNSDEETKKWIKSCRYVKEATFVGDNIGIPLAWDHITEKIKRKREYDFIAHIDNDVFMATPKWLTNLIDAYRTLFGLGLGMMGIKLIASHQDNAIFAEARKGDYTYKFYDRLMPGCFLFFPSRFLDGFTLDPGYPMHSGDYFISQHCIRRKIPMAYVDEIQAILFDYKKSGKARDDREVRGFIPYGI